MDPLHQTAASDACTAPVGTGTAVDAVRHAPDTSDTTRGIVDAAPPDVLADREARALLGARHGWKSPSPWRRPARAGRRVRPSGRHAASPRPAGPGASG